MMKTLVSIIIFLTAGSLSAQVIDSTVLQVPSDSTFSQIMDSTAIQDSLKEEAKTDIDAVVFASAADSLTFDIQNKRMYLYGKSELKYKQTDLKSGKIRVNFDTNDLEADGIKDTSAAPDSQLTQTPVLTEGGESYKGTHMRYNFKTQRGFISLAKTKDGDQTYGGEKVNKVAKDTYFIKDGVYTTCDGDPPHTYFSADEMKVIQNDKIIAKWIFMYIGGVPFPVPLPFAVFPNESGRRSGIIIPGYGQSADRGQYFRNFGYFFALSDYMDLALTGDYYTKGGWGARARYRYAKRYDFTGSINAGYSKISVGEENDPDRREQVDWNLSVYHNQQFNPSTRLDVNLQFQSSSYLTNNSISYNDLLSKDIISNATLSKRWDELGASMTLNYSRRQNLESGDIYETLPNLTFTKSQSYPFRSESATSLRDQKWYELIAYNYSGQFRNERKKISGDLNIRGGIQHSFSVNASPKIGYFSVSPSVNYREKWYNKHIRKENLIISEIDTSTGQTILRDSVVDRDINEINFVRTFDFSLSASTKLYGIFQPNIFGIEAFRHTLSPSISYNYQPDFSRDQWGYYDTYTNAQGEKVRYDKYQKEIFGGVSRGERQSLNLSLGNVFEMKSKKDPSDTTSAGENKIQLLNLTAGVGYNFAADSLKLSDLRVSYRTQIGNLINFSGSSSYTFYDFDGNTKINQFLASEGKGLLRLTNFNFSVSTTLSGDKIKGEERTGETEQETEQGFNAFEQSDFIALYEEQPPDFSIPWNLNLNYNYNLSKPTPNQVIKSSNIGLDLSVNLTKYWKLTFRGSYDFERKEISAPQVTIYRDLHCWEMNFVWNPLGVYRGFRFEIRMKAPELQDIKVTKSKGLFTGRR